MSAFKEWAEHADVIADIKALISSQYGKIKRLVEDSIEAGRKIGEIGVRIRHCKALGVYR